MLKGIAARALMVQSYVVTEDDNNRLNSNTEIFEWLVNALKCAIRGSAFYGYVFNVYEVIRVR